MNSIKNDDNPEIPLKAGQVLGWKEIPIREARQPDPLVPLGPMSQETSLLTTSSIYFGEHSNSPYARRANKLTGSLLTLFARRSVARRLLIAEHLLPSGYHLLVFDAYRPYQVQQSLYDFYKQKLQERHPEMDNEMLDRITQDYVSLPSRNITRPSPHNTGGAVDVVIVKLDRTKEKELLKIRTKLTDPDLNITKRISLEVQLSAIMRLHSKMLNFGTKFDHGGKKSALAYYENLIADHQALSSTDKEACENRRLLYRVMTQVGFQPYFSEWWHFNAPESQMGAATAGHKLATFGPVDINESNRMHELNRLQIRRSVLMLQKDSNIAKDWPTEIIAPSET